ncbi:MAG TPA: 3-carboxy-cis,cis-muconate cycloisomerase, partial [Chloroflexi bacterium]|nr:3-carboxy-cis,cis-muconate cycloisomerase [Chloroflexota bacterium]
MRTSNRRIANLFAPSGWARQCCQVEAALALVQAEIGVIPADAGPGIAQHLHDAVIDHDALAKAAERTGFAIAPLIRQLTPQCGPFGGWLHWGATTQDILVTVRALQINESLKLLGQRLARIVSAVAKLADEHRHSMMPARAFGGHGGVTTFGLHCATWLSSLVRDADRLMELTRRPVAGEL